MKEIAERKKEKIKHHEEDLLAFIIIKHLLLKKNKDYIKNPHAKKQQLNC